MLGVFLFLLLLLFRGGCQTLPLPHGTNTVVIVVDHFHIHVFVHSSNIWLSYIHSYFCSFIIDSQEKKRALTKAYIFTLKAEKLFWTLFM